jgi:hypothetical protein
LAAAQIAPFGEGRDVDAISTTSRTRGVGPLRLFGIHVLVKRATAVPPRTATKHTHSKRVATRDDVELSSDERN